MGSKITPSSGKVFADLGFEAEEAEHLRIRSDLMIALRTVIQDCKLTQAEAARVFGVTQPRISNLVRGRIYHAVAPIGAGLRALESKGISGALH